MDRLLFGDNQFFGVNHMSEEKARAQAAQFHDLASIMAVLDAAYDEGLHTFMCTTHERVGEICATIRNAPARYADFTFYPSLPYAHKYANAVTENGLVAAVRQFLPRDGAVAAAARGGRAVATKDISALLGLLVDAELRMFEGLRTPVVFLQNVVVDLLLGLGFVDAFRLFADHIAERYGAEPGFITMNLPALVPALASVGLEKPLVCTNLNSAGFRMSGGLAAYEDVLEAGGARVIAMSVFASGALSPREAIEWVCARPHVEAIVFGASSAGNIRQTVELVDECWTGR